MPSSGILTLLTDFGVTDAYVAAMKGVVLSHAPDVRLVDVSHEIPPQDVGRAAWVLASAVPWFPTGTVHVAVVDPGVGTARRAIVAEVDLQLVVAPDNGLVSDLWRAGHACRCFALTDPAHRLAEVSATFHGRDIFAPVGALLASGAIDVTECGPEVEPMLLERPEPTADEAGIHGEVVTVDGFGNLITNVTDEQIRLLPDVSRVRVGEVAAQWVRTYGEAPPGTVVALIGSGGLLEISVVEGNAAATLGLSAGVTFDIEAPKLPEA